MKNTSRDLPPDNIEWTIKTYMDELEHGGYSSSWREKVLEAATRGYERLWMMEIEGKGRLNRPEASSRKTRRWKKLMGKTNWFQPGGIQEDQKDPPPHHHKNNNKKKGKNITPQASAKVESVLYV